MIPKKIHYCWFGGSPLPAKAKKIIETWRKFCPDYEIIEWNETNYDVHKNKYMADAYKEKKWGFVSDYSRLDIIYNEGGFYLDTDVELLKSLDELRENEAYMGFEGAEKVEAVASGLGFGAVKENETIKALRDLYESLNFYNLDGSLNLTPCPKYQTDFFLKWGLKINNKFQTIAGVKIYPTEYFDPKDYYFGKTYVTKNTISIHQYEMSWKSKKDKRNQHIKWLIGKKNYEWLYKITHRRKNEK
ncbi:glycosyltransferase [Lactovum odontotermitis]